ncbi:hypothetical protein AAF712_004586, partial [Marasmius tenuissimus]
MADNTPTQSSEANDIEWTAERSEKGKLYLVGVENPELAVKADSEATAAQGGDSATPIPASDLIPVNWPVGDETWKSTAGTPIANIGITR